MSPDDELAPLGATGGLPRGPRVKICGITRPQDAACAAALGADAIGLVFYPPSPRVVDPEQARAVVRALPPFVTAVGVFLNDEPRRIRAVLETVHLDLLQFHGDETPEECERFRRPYIKALRVRDGVDLAELGARYAGAAGLLLDTYHAQRRGGTGITFDWTLIPSELGKPLILAGGLSAGNVAQAVAQVRPYAVDVSSGVESKGGVKDAAKMAAFMREVYGATEIETQC